MNIIGNIFTKKNDPITNYRVFWEWFAFHQKEFYAIVKSRTDIEKNFFTKLSPKLAEIKDGYYFLSGMLNETTAELILTADGDPRNIVFVEELVEQSPTLAGWKFTALRPSADIKDVRIELGDYTFSGDNIFFYSNDLPHYPDEIDISIIYSDWREEDEKEITRGVYIFLDDYLGEIDAITKIDGITVMGKSQARKELIPIAKLKSFLDWRHKEFIEMYDGLYYETEGDEYAILEADLTNGNRLVAVINANLLAWAHKVSHPWIAIIIIKYDGSKNNGLPDEEDYEALNKIEERVLDALKAKDGYLNIGRQTADGEREIYFSCKEFRKPSKVFFSMKQKFVGVHEIEYEIYKDKYWQSFERFYNR